MEMAQHFDPNELHAALPAAVRLHREGQHDAAWSELNRCVQLATSCPYLGVAPMLVGEVYDKMRLCLQRERRFAEAVPLRVLSYCYQAQGFYLQSRWQEFNNLNGRMSFTDRLSKDLKKAGALDSLEALYVLATDAIRMFPRLEGSEIRKRATDIVSRGIGKK